MISYVFKCCHENIFWEWLFSDYAQLWAEATLEKILQRLCQREQLAVKGSASSLLHSRAWSVPGLGGLGQFCSTKANL